MLEVIPKGWIGYDYEVTHNEERVVDIHQSKFREEAELTILGEMYQKGERRYDSENDTLRQSHLRSTRLRSNYSARS